MALGNVGSYFPQFEILAAAFAMAGEGNSSSGSFATAGAYGLDSFAPSEEMGEGYGGGAAAFAMVAAMNGGFRHHCHCHEAGSIAMAGAWSSQSSRVTDDPYGVAQSGQGQKSNLANSPEAVLALNAVMASGATSYDDIAKQLRDKFGINAAVGEVDKDGHIVSVDDPSQTGQQAQDGQKSGDAQSGTKAVVFGNGDYFIDGNGNGSLDSGDYQFSQAIDNIKQKYGMSDDAMKNLQDRYSKIAQSKETDTQNGLGGDRYPGAFGSPGNAFYGGFPGGNLLPFPGGSGQRDFGSMLGYPPDGFQGFGNAQLEQQVMELFMEALALASRLGFQAA